MNTPLLLIAWRRPRSLRQVISALRPVAPTRLYVACDGPRLEQLGEAEKVAATRAVIEHEIDWPCQIERLYSAVNQGCRLGVSRAITWFFEQVEEGIILEDDCVPHPDFFPYCTTLLERYRHDTRVWSICGSNFQLGNKRGDASYYFSIHGDSWGWASWRRAWNHYPDAETNWPSFRDNGRLADILPINQERKDWEEALNSLFEKNKPNTWDYQRWLCTWMNNGLHAWPNVPLVKNIGFDDQATNTLGPIGTFGEVVLCSLGVIMHPDAVLPDRAADKFAYLYRRNGLKSIEKAKQVELRKRYGFFYILISKYRNLKDRFMEIFWANA